MDNDTSTVYCPPSVNTDLSQGDESTSEIHNVSSKKDSTLNIVQQSEINIPVADSDDDESAKPTVSVVIDDDEAHVSTENDHSEITSTTVEEMPNCFIDVL